MPEPIKTAIKFSKVNLYCAGCGNWIEVDGPLSKWFGPGPPIICQHCHRDEIIDIIRLPRTSIE